MTPDVKSVRLHIEAGVGSCFCAFLCGLFGYFNLAGALAALGVVLVILGVA